VRADRLVSSVAAAAIGLAQNASERVAASVFGCSCGLLDARGGTFEVDRAEHLDGAVPAAWIVEPAVVVEDRERELQGDGRVDGTGRMLVSTLNDWTLGTPRDRTYAGSRCALEAHIEAPILGPEALRWAQNDGGMDSETLIRARQSAVHCDLNAPQETMRVIGRLQVP
jgi:hypothetical protein